MTALACAVLLAGAVLVWPAPRRMVPARRRVASAPWTTWPRRRAGRGRPDGLETPVLLQVLEAVAAQVRGGAVPSAAWDCALDVIGPSAGHLPRAGSDPLARALREMGTGDPLVASVAAAWALAQDVGASLADVLDQVAAGLRAEAEIEAEIQASLAAPRATARLLAGLPVAGVGLGELIGAGPLGVLVGTPTGRLAGLAGVGLAVAGQLWTRRLVARAAATP